MKNQLRATTSPLIAIGVMLIALAASSFAHGGVDHIRGAGGRVKNRVLTVSTSTGNVAVKLDGQTQLTKDGQRAQLSDLVPEVRVIAEVPHEKDKAAQSVKIGAAPQAATAHKRVAKK